MAKTIFWNSQFIQGGVGRTNSLAYVVPFLACGRLLLYSVTWH